MLTSPLRPVRRGVQRTLLMATLVLVALLSSMLTAAALPVSGHAELSPERSGDRAVTVLGKVTLSGSAPRGDIDRAWISCTERAGDTQRIELSRTILNRNPQPTGDYLRNDLGELSGRVTVSCTVDDLEADELLDVWLELSIAGETVLSSRVPVDTRRPVILRYEVIAPRQIRVVFDESVRQPQGESPSDWVITDPANEVVHVSRGPEGDCSAPGIRARSDIPGGTSGCTRLLDLSSAVGEDVRPTVRYRPTEAGDTTEVPTRQAHLDWASNNARAASGIYDLVAHDLIRPALPRVTAVGDAPVSSGSAAIAGSASAPTVHVANVSDGHLVHVEAMTSSGRRTSGTSVRADGGTASPRAPELAGSDDGTYTLVPVVTDPHGNRSDERDKNPPRADGSPSSVVYRLDQGAPAATAAVGDGEFVTIYFSEPVSGPNEAAEWTISNGVPVQSVSGSGDFRMLRTSGTASGKVAYHPEEGSSPDGLADDVGNPVTGFPLDIQTAGGLSLTGASATEGAPLTFTVSVARLKGDRDTATYAVNYATEDDTATAGTDYTATSGRLEFPPGTSSRTVTVPTTQDDGAEGAETMRLRLSDATGGASLPTPPTATGTILEPATDPEVSVFDTRANEGSHARVLVQLSEPASDEVTVAWRTEDGSAAAGDDYTAGSGTARIPAGETETTLRIALAEDDRDEPTETFSVVLSDPTNATLGRARADVLVIDGAGVPGGIQRLSGATRVETSAAVSRAVYSSADTVVIATAEAYPDALAGAPLAARHGAPILLTGRAGLHPAIRDEVRRLGADTAIVLGGAKALSSQVDDDLRAAGVGTVRRIAGSNRFATAERIAADLGGDVVYVVEGAHADPARGWPDAVAVSALAAYQERPILLVERDRLPDETRAALRRSSPRLATIAGGSAAVSGAVANAIDVEAERVNRLAGRTRYETSRAIADASVTAGMDPATTWFATGADWPDSLSASPAVARTGGVLLLVASDRLDDSPPTRDWLVTHRDDLRSVVLVGGTKAISARVADQIRSQTGLSPR